MLSSIACDQRLQLIDLRLLKNAQILLYFTSQVPVGIPSGLHVD